MNGSNWPGRADGIAMILAEELDADWSQVVAELAPAADIYKDPLFGIQMVGGSGSIAHSFQQYRELGGKTRAMLLAAAAGRWKVTPDKCRTEASVVYGPSGQSAKYAELAGEAARQTLPAACESRTAEIRCRQKIRRLDSRRSVTVLQKIGLDSDFPGMRGAVWHIHGFSEAP